MSRTNRAPSLHLSLAERALQQQPEAVVLGRIHFEDGAADDIAQRRLVPRVGEPLQGRGSLRRRAKADHRHLVVFGIDEVVGADHVELTRHRTVVHRPGFHQFVQSGMRARAAAHSDAEQFVLGRGRIFGAPSRWSLAVELIAHRLSRNLARPRFGRVTVAGHHFTVDEGRVIALCGEHQS